MSFSLENIGPLRPPWSDKVFPVGRVGKILASREVGITPPPLILVLYKLECTGEKKNKKIKKFETWKKKKNPTRSFKTQSGGPQETNFFLGGLGQHYWY